jgi:DNA-binding MarR family transcriptional regulator
MSRQVLIDQPSRAVDAWVVLLRAHASTTRSLSASLLADHGLTLNDYEALLRLSRAEGRRMRRVDLAGELLLTASGVTRLLDGLERCGYVEKGTCSSDARVTYAVLTDAGRAKLQEASSSHVTQVRELFEEHLSTAELRTLADLLSRLPGVAPAADEDCSP